MPAPLFKPPVRDTTTNSTAEIVSRLAVVVTVLGAVVVPLLLIDAFRRGDAVKGFFAVALALFAAGLLLARTRLRSKTTAAPTPISPTIEPTDSPSAVSPTTASRPRLLLLNASLAGPTGNSAAALAHLARHLAPHAELTTATLAGPTAATFTELAPALQAADGFVIATGTHWDSWSSPLQRFLEDATPAEGTTLWLGKPAAVLVTEHSTGGKGVLSRLQGVLVTLGGIIPPMSGVVLSQATQLALAAAAPGASPDTPAGEADFWSVDDFPVVAHNLLTAARLRATVRPDWQAWPVDRTAIHARWLR